MRKAQAAAVAGRAFLLIVITMALDQVKRFERWRRRSQGYAAHLITLVVNEVVPLFEAQGFRWYRDYAGGSTYALGPNTIPLQRRVGFEWPTVEIMFDERLRPAFGVTFAMLPAKCYRYRSGDFIEVDRLEASVVEGPAFFHLCKGGRRYNNCNFGYYYFSFFPTLTLRRECDSLKALLPWLWRVLDGGIPRSWLEQSPGYVDEHAFLSGGSTIFARRRSARC